MHSISDALINHGPNGRVQIALLETHSLALIADPHSGSINHPSFFSQVILIADPSLRKQLLIKKALLDRAVEGMGHHGLVGTSNDALMNLHEALKLEFERVIQQYKGAIAKIDELSIARNIKDSGPVTRSLSQGPAPTFSSHQRLLSLKQEEIQHRLNKNRSLLCALEPCFRTNHSLQILLAILQKRIDYDKETLFQFGQLRKEYVSSCGPPTDPSSPFSARHKPVTQLSSPFERDTVVAPVLMRFSHGCAQVGALCPKFLPSSLSHYPTWDLLLHLTRSDTFQAVDSSRSVTQSWLARAPKGKPTGD